MAYSDSEPKLELDPDTTKLISGRCLLFFFFSLGCNSNPRKKGLAATSKEAMVVIDESWTRGNNENDHVLAITLATARLWPLGQADSTGLDEIVGALSKLSTDELCALKEAVDRKLFVPKEI